MCVTYFYKTATGVRSPLELYLCIKHAVENTPGRVVIVPSKLQMGGYNETM